MEEPANISNSICSHNETIDKFKEHISNTLNDMRQQFEQQLKQTEQDLLRQLKDLEDSISTRDRPLTNQRIKKRSTHFGDETKPKATTPERTISAPDDCSVSFSKNGPNTVGSTRRALNKSKPEKKKEILLGLNEVKFSSLQECAPPREPMISPTRIVTAKRCVSSALYQNLAEIQAKQQTKTPKKFKDAFEGRAAVSFLLVHLELPSRAMAVTLCECLDDYIECVNNPMARFLDTEEYYYQFRFPVFMPAHKLTKELRPSAEMLLQKFGPENGFFSLVTSSAITAEGPLMVNQLEISTTKGRRWNSRYCHLFWNFLYIYKSEEEQEIIQKIPVDSIKSIVLHSSSDDILDIVKKSSSNCVASFVVNYLYEEQTSSFVFRVPNDLINTTLWALTLDGLIYQRIPLMSEENGCCIDNPIKVLLLRKLFKSGYAGGLVKSNDEEWQYNSDGSIQCVVGKHKVNYTWTGEFLQPSLGGDIVNFGTGKWDGSNAWWFPPTSESDGLRNVMGQCRFARKPWSHYLYSPLNREYLSEDSTGEWKWSRHFLASKDNEPEWILEGEIPEPVVMLLQMMRHYVATSKTVVVSVTPNCAVKDDINFSPTVLLRSKSVADYRNVNTKRRKTFDNSAKLLIKRKSSKFNQPLQH